MTLAMLKLESAYLIEEASRQTGLTDFGMDTSFENHLEVLIRSLKEEAKLHRLGRAVFCGWLVRLLKNRLMIEADSRMKSQLRVAAPVFIVGPPRSGTTLIHRLLAQNPLLRAPTMWEMMSPSTRGLAPADANSTRFRLADEAVKRTMAANTSLANIHTLAANAPEECFWILEHTFLDPVFELNAHIPTYSAWLRLHIDNPTHYRFHSAFLNLLENDEKRSAWILKSPRHLLALDALLETYPDATIIMTHRDPTALVLSMCSLVRATRAMHSESVDARTIGKDWVDRMDRNLRSFELAKARWKNSRFIDVNYAELVKDPLGQFRRISIALDKWSAQHAETKARTWLQSSAESKPGVHHYSAEEFGISADELESRFAWYRETYGLN